MCLQVKLLWFSGGVAKMQMDRLAFDCLPAQTYLRHAALALAWRQLPHHSHTAPLTPSAAGSERRMCDEWQNCSTSQRRLLSYLLRQTLPLQHAAYRLHRSAIHLPLALGQQQVARWVSGNCIGCTKAVQALVFYASDSSLHLGMLNNLPYSYS